MIEAFPLEAAVGIFEIDGRAILVGGGFCVDFNTLSTVPFELLALTVQTNSFAE